jgi:hypothetical protein
MLPWQTITMISLTVWHWLTWTCTSHIGQTYFVGQLLVVHWDCCRVSWDSEWRAGTSIVQGQLGCHSGWRVGRTTHRPVPCAPTRLCGGFWGGGTLLSPRRAPEPPRVSSEPTNWTRINSDGSLGPGARRPGRCSHSRVRALPAQAKGISAQGPAVKSTASTGEQAGPTGRADPRGDWAEWPRRASKFWGRRRVRSKLTFFFLIIFLWKLISVFNKRHIVSPALLLLTRTPLYLFTSV